MEVRVRDECPVISIAFFGLAVGMLLSVLVLSAGCRCGRTSSHGTAAPVETRANLADDGPGRAWGGTARSCKGLAPTCGPSGNDDCCKSLRVPGGTFARSYDGVDFLDKSFPATVSDFYLDKYEVTVGRFRAFVNAGMGTQKNPPREDTGAHPKIAGSGWDSAWNAKLPAKMDALKAALKCHTSFQTWTDAPGSNESKPVNCLDWYAAFAFCAWDGGRLATEAEWNYAAAGGSEQRYYPWSIPPSSTAIDDSYAVYCGGTCKLLDVGAKSPKGDGRWGQSDLGGNAWEWTLDWDPVQYPMPCHDCAHVKAGTYRAFRSGSNDDIAATLRSSVRHVYYPDYRGVNGARCARTP
ncbi:MAG: SUMF1/EgtB/PvdO family nonheme iron enzyme [Deltaproteobacteria bacterium]|nr:SUMF1/EgtB/PvdO family nonheme iron enzyme [Deltaproteobacteria bacterium]